MALGRGDNSGEDASLTPAAGNENSSTDSSSEEASKEEPKPEDEKFNMEVSPSSITLKEGEDATITVSGPSSPEFSSSDSSVATVSGSGKVTAVKAGDATITVSSDKYNPATVKVHVDPAPVVENKNFNIKKSDFEMKKGDKDKITVTEGPSKIQRLQQLQRTAPSLLSLQVQLRSH